MASFFDETFQVEPVIVKDELLTDGKRYTQAVPQGGVCSQLIEVLTENEKILQVRYTGGCSGNTQGVAILAKDGKITDIADRLNGISCGGNITSCPDQLSKVLQYIINNPK